MSKTSPKLRAVEEMRKWGSAQRRAPQDTVMEGLGDEAEHRAEPRAPCLLRMGALGGGSRGGGGRGSEQMGGRCGGWRRGGEEREEEKSPHKVAGIRDRSL